MLDPRRTPVRVVDVRPATGFVVLRIEAFEDEGARWEIPFDRIDRYQFGRGGPRASAEEVRAFEAAVARHATRLIDVESPSDEDLTTLEAVDVASVPVSVEPDSS